MKMKKLFAICLVALSALISVHLQAQEVETLVLIDTDMGKIKVKLFNDTPQHRDNFIKNVKEHRYDGLLFHRVIKQFMVQAGDINSKDAPMEQHLGDGDLDYTIPAEIVYPKYFHKRGMFAAAPRFAILDPAYTLSLPRMQVLSGAFDTLSHAMETYFGRSDRDNVSDEVALAVMRSTVTNMRALLQDIDDYTARSNLMWTSAMAENGILKAGRVTDFECHQMEHQLGAYTDCNHGQGLAVLHPAYYRHIVKDAPEKFARLGRAVFGVEGAEAAADALADFIQECGLPTKLSQLKSKAEITPALLRQVADSTNLLPNGPRQLTHDEVYDILMECM